jgi:peptide/nickel transport system substrate-binding protein
MAVSRRTALASIAAGATGLSGGCVRRLRTSVGWRSPTRVSLEIKTVPADADPYALRVARYVSRWFQAAGIDARVTPMAEEELLRQVLLNGDFDVFVAHAPARFRTPDALYSLLHSRFADTPGWQNPFGYANLDVDDALETQRVVSGDNRRGVVADLQRTAARTQPFTLLAFPDDVRAVRSDHYANWRDAELTSPQGYLRVERVPRGRSDDPRSRDELRLVVTDRRATENLNPLAVEFRRYGLFTGLLYDSLGYVTGMGTTERWLAESWAFTAADGVRATVRLRPDLTWHDGEPLTAEDVAFTYRLFADTTLSADAEVDAIPAPRFSGRISLVDGVRAVDDGTVEFAFAECSPTVATRAFTVPILPKHVWQERTDSASVAGIDVGSATEALVTTNIPPVGSGPLEFVRNTPGETLVLEPFEEHFLGRETVSGAPTPLANGPAFDRLVVRVVGSDDPAVEMVADGEADVTGTAVGADTVPRIGRADDLDLLVGRSNAPYILGYNARRTPLTNPRFRNTLAQLVDRSYLADEVFDGYARPAASPLAGTDWLPTDLRWDGSAPVVPFLGTDGELAVGRARDAFREAGYQYDGDHLVEAT